MTIRLNEQSKEVPDETTVYALLANEGIDPEVKGTAVAVNAEVVPRSEWKETRLRDGDVVDIIKAVQGG